MKAAYLHLLTDVMTSIAVVIGGVLMYYLIKESIEILMQSTPNSIDIKKIKKDVEGINKIKNIHHLHIWKLDDHDIHLEAHIDFDDNLNLGDITKIIGKVAKNLKETHHIAHITIQAEYDKSDDKKLVGS